MPATVVVGLQWGDEGKGKVVDLLAGSVSLVVRYQGGDNAGHTIVLGEDTFKLHLVPSGVLHPNITPLIGPGVVVNPRSLIAEMEMLEGRGVDCSAVRVSTAAHVIMPYHVALDRAREAAAGSGAIGTTGRGIGPAYCDRALRSGIRMGDLLEPDWLRRRLAAVVAEKRALLALPDTDRSLDLDELLATGLAWGERLRDHITDTTAVVQHALAEGRHVLLEGAQGTLLDLDHGTFPYVTSSNPVAGGACAGAGIGPLQIGAVIGVLKAYSTRVGAGPLPTELDDDTGRHLLEKGREYGTTTGRRRRCGWLDLVPLRRSVAINSATGLMLNKIDILAGLPEVRVCVAYRVDGRLVDDWPVSLAELERAQPVYETFRGWPQPLSELTTFDQLPDEAQAYVAAIEARAGVAVAAVSVGPDRRQTLLRTPPEQLLAGGRRPVEAAAGA